MTIRVALLLLRVLWSAFRPKTRDESRRSSERVAARLSAYVFPSRGAVRSRAQASGGDGSLGVRLDGGSSRRPQSTLPPLRPSGDSSAAVGVAAVGNLQPVSPYVEADWDGHVQRQTSSARRREVEIARTAPSVKVIGVAAVVWFIVALIGILWSWQGTDPRYFASPDEAIQRKAAELVAQRGSPALDLPTEDPEDLAHGRFWITIDDQSAIPAYPPVAYFVQGALLRLPGPGALAVAALAATGLAALAAGVMTLGSRRTWIGALAPLAAFPALYWLMRPWMNMSTCLTFICLALLCWAIWRRTHLRRWLFGSAALMGLAVAVRPDYAPFLFALSVLATIGEGVGGQRKSLALASTLTVVTAVGLNLILNELTTGDPLQTGYEIVDQRREGAIANILPEPLGKLNFLLLPYGIPSLSLVKDQVYRYWFEMSSVALLTVGAFGSSALLLKAAPRGKRVAYGACLLACILFVLTHLSDAVYGANESTALLRHSVTRYWTPVYLFAAVPLLVVAMNHDREGVWVGAFALVCVLAIGGGRDIYTGQPESLSGLRRTQQQMAQTVAAWRDAVPEDAVVYSYNLDKVLWPHWELGSLSSRYDHQATAGSIERILSSNRDVYIIQMKWPSQKYEEGLRDALNSRGLSLDKVSSQDGVYIVTPQAVERRPRR